MNFFLSFIYLRYAVVPLKSYCRCISRPCSICSHDNSVTWCLLSFHSAFCWSFFFLLHRRTDFPSLSFLSNSIHERYTLHHSVCLYLCLPFIFSTPFCTRERRQKGAGGGGINRKRWGRARWTDWVTVISDQSQGQTARGGPLFGSTQFFF